MIKWEHIEESHLKRVLENWYMTARHLSGSVTTRDDAYEWVVGILEHGRVLSWGTCKSAKSAKQTVHKEIKKIVYDSYKGSVRNYVRNRKKSPD